MLKYIRLSRVVVKANAKTVFLLQLYVIGYLPWNNVEYLINLPWQSRILFPPSLTKNSDKLYTQDPLEAHGSTGLNTEVSLSLQIKTYTVHSHTGSNSGPTPSTPLADEYQVGRACDDKRSSSSNLISNALPIVPILSEQNISK